MTNKGNPVIDNYTLIRSEIEAALDTYTEISAESVGFKVRDDGFFDAEVYGDEGEVTAAVSFKLEFLK